MTFWLVPTKLLPKMVWDVGGGRRVFLPLHQRPNNCICSFTAILVTNGRHFAPVEHPPVREKEAFPLLSLGFRRLPPQLLSDKVRLGLWRASAEARNAPSRDPGVPPLPPPRFRGGGVLPHLPPRRTEGAPGGATLQLPSSSARSWSPLPPPRRPPSCRRLPLPFLLEVHGRRSAPLPRRERPEGETV